MADLSALVYITKASWLVLVTLSPSPVVCDLPSRPGDVGFHIANRHCWVHDMDDIAIKHLPDGIHGITTP